MPSLLDTDIIIDHLERQPETTALIARLAPDRVALSVVSSMEVYQAILRSIASPGNKKALYTETA